MSEERSVKKGIVDKGTVKKVIATEAAPIQKRSIRDGYGDGLLAAGMINKDVVVLTADLSSSTKCDQFAKNFPSRFFQLGITEQHMMSAAAGMATAGKIPFVNSFAAFNPGRNWDQLRVSVCYSNLNVKVHGSHAGLTVGQDGATHQALEDIAITRVLPNMTVIVPCDAEEAKLATIAAAQHLGPVYLRTSRHSVPIVSSGNFKIGKAEVLKLGNDVSIIACGVMVGVALDAADKLKAKGISAEVINCATVKPLDSKVILSSVVKTKKAVVCEEHQITGGLGGAVAEFLSAELPTPVLFVGVENTFGESGSGDELLTAYGLDASSVASKTLEFCRRLSK